ncbi:MULTISPECIES: TonB-dependent receptor [unclassified Sphingomonas]|uniref:TonB-dependent receptor plug domain-containing protein n=1 Tax=unclassified Sphingomonas TaxID=196159 RepID=UPI00226A2B0B
MKSLFLISAALIPAALIASPAAAQVAPADTGLDSVAPGTDVIVTASRVPQDAREVGQAVTVIDRAEIERRQTTVLSDLLATTPGVTVTRNGGIGTLTSVRIRGAEAEQTLVVIDGVRVNDPSSASGGYDFANLLSASVARIEVLRGPNAVPWGSQAIGGVVNIITETPTEGLHARARAEGGYAGTAFASAGLSGATGNLSGALTAGYLRTDGISAAAIGTERDGYEQIGGTGRLDYEIAPGIGIDLRGYYAHSKANFDGFPPPNYTLADDSEYGTAQEIYGYAGLHANLLGDRLRNRIAFTIADINRDNYDPTQDPTETFLARGRSERYEYQGDFTLTQQIRLVGGAERENSRFYDGFTTERTGITSVYGEAIVKPIRELTITGGVRNDDHDTFGNHTSFGADAALALRTGTTLRASYGEGFKAPTLYQLYSAYGNTRLSPEVARNYDLGVEQSLLGGRAVASATYFNRITRNQITFRSCTRLEQLTSGSICVDRAFGVYDNIARATADGVELTLALKPVDALTFSANYSYIDAKNRTPGTAYGLDLARRPHQTISTNVDYRFPFGLQIGGTVTAVGDSFDNAANTVRLDGYALLGVRAEMPINRRIAVYGRVDNVTDQSYRVIAGYGTYGRAAYGGVRVSLD